MCVERTVVGAKTSRVYWRRTLFSRFSTISVTNLRAHSVVVVSRRAKYPTCRTNRIIRRPRQYKIPSVREESARTRARERGQSVRRHARKSSTTRDSYVSIYMCVCVNFVRGRVFAPGWLTIGVRVEIKRRKLRSGKPRRYIYIYRRFVYWACCNRSGGFFPERKTILIIWPRYSSITRARIFLVNGPTNVVSQTRSHLLSAQQVYAHNVYSRGAGERPADVHRPVVYATVPN